MEIQLSHNLGFFSLSLSEKKGLSMIHEQYLVAT